MHPTRPKLADFIDAKTAKLAKAGHHIMCHHITIAEAFPLPINKEELSWKCLLKASQGDQEMMGELEDVEGNAALKSCLIDYVHAPLSFNPWPNSYLLGMGSWDSTER